MGEHKSRFTGEFNSHWDIAKVIKMDGLNALMQGKCPSIDFFLQGNNAPIPVPVAVMNDYQERTHKIELNYGTNY